jgi:DNA-binding transcriptional LysR family regulator
MATSFRSLDLNLLRVFDAVMAEGSLTRAAQAMAMTQPALSHAIKRLRGAVGEDLFVRTATGMRPTARAEQLWPQVRDALGSLRLALAPDDFDPVSDAVQFRLAMADATAVLLSPGLVGAVDSEHLAVNFRILPLTTRDPRQLLANGEVDLAVGFFPEVMAALAVQGASTALRHGRLYTTRYVCVMRRGHPLSAAPLTLDAYCAAHHLLVSFSGRPHGYVDQALASMGRQRRIVLTVNQFFTAGRVVAQSDLLTVLPEGFVEATGYRRELVTRDLPLELFPVHVDMLWHRRHEAHPSQQWLRQRVIDAAAAAAEEPSRQGVALSR